MLTFAQFLTDAAQKGEAVNTLFEERLFNLVLSSFRLKDQVHIQAMDAAGLITSDVERKLTKELLTRLQHVRETE
jgi:hypothetical protein